MQANRDLRKVRFENLDIVSKVLYEDVYLLGGLLRGMGLGDKVDKGDWEIGG